MKALVIGSGGREHALVKALQNSPKIEQVLAAPGNPGMAADAQCFPVPVSDIPGLVKLAQEQGADLTVVGPEAPLVEGVVDAFEKAGLKVFGPNKRAAILEESKIFTKDFLKKYQIPTAKYEVFDNLEAAQEFVRANPHTEWVVKVDGLAAGKGVFVSRTQEATLAALEKVFVEKAFGDQSVVVEEFLDGEEVSFMVLCDGKRGLPLASSQDHKRLLNHDKGPNTGGMGAYSPAPIMTPDLHEKVMTQVVGPTLTGMEAEGRPFSGVLYAGLMVVNGEPLVLEYNVRFGDPEAQVIMPRLKTDWVDLIEAALTGNLDQIKCEWEEKSAVVVVLAAAGYPTSPTKGDIISGLEAAGEIGIVYHAGTAKSGDDFVTAGGRVLGVTALGHDLAEAHHEAYQAVKKIKFNGMQFRTDIAHRGLEHSVLK